MGDPLGDIRLAMQAMLVVWIWLVVLIVRRTTAQGSVGLPAGMALTTTALYGGCFVYAMPGYEHTRIGAHWYLNLHVFTPQMIMQATFASLLAMLGLAIGCRVWSPRPVAVAAVKAAPPLSPTQGRSMLNTLGLITLVCYALDYLDITFPLSGVILENGRNLAVVTIGLGMYLAVRDGKPILKWLLLAPVVPAYFLFAKGFVSFSMLFGLTLLAFWMAQIQQRRTGVSTLWRIGVTVVLVYAFLTLFVGWFSFRNEIRLILWQSGGGSILGVIGRAIVETEVFSPWNFEALDLVNIRLNQNIFIGRLIAEHQLFPELRQYGATLIILPLVLVPRFIWPGKPGRGGSDFMSENTGITFADSGSTFGTGPIFEFYVNLGYAGVFLGFLAAGRLLSYIDRSAAQHLHAGRIMDFARLYVVGIVMLNPLARPFFIVNSAVFAWLIMSALKIALERAGTVPATGEPMRPARPASPEAPPLRQERSPE